MPIIIYDQLKAIRHKCLDCSNGNQVEVRLCPCTDCSLYPYRFGHKPKKTWCTVGSDGLNADGEEIIDKRSALKKNAVDKEVGDDNGS